jgi:signal transduction histidine kinase
VIAIEPTRGPSDQASVAGSLLSVLVDLSFARELGQVMETARRAVRRLTGADGVTFVLRQAETCFYADEDAIAPLWKGRRFPLGECVSGWVMLNRRTAIIPDVYDDSRVPAAAYRPTFVQSLLMVPVRSDDPVGAIGVYWASRHEATADEQAIAQAIANGAALAMANVKLVRDLEEAAERERNARLVAERANRLRDQFLATVSHELRTPLGVIHGWLWQLRKPGLDAEQRRHGLDVVSRNATIQQRLVEDLIDASSALSGTLQVDMDVVDVRDPCRQASDSMQAAARARQLTLELMVGDDELPVVGDRERLRQIVRNLLENSIKFTPPGGRVVVSAWRQREKVSLRVQDTGIGIRADALGQVFDPFWQLDGSARREAGGLGLGLSLVHELVRLHGGVVVAESAGENAGTTVTVELAAAASSVGRGDSRTAEGEARS